MSVLTQITQSLYAAIGMFWQVFWGLVLGFALSGVTMAYVPRRLVARRLGRAGARELALATLLGAASSSCSYAAAAVSRSLFRKGADIAAALAFLLASTNLVLELSAMLWVMLGWRFVVAELLGGVVMIAVMAVLLRACPPLRRAFAARQERIEEDKGPSENAETGLAAVARGFVSEWAMVGKDLALGMVVSGALMVFVPDSFWAALFLRGGRGWARWLENALVGPLVSMLSFTCSIGNIPLAATLYRGGIGFGGALSFIYADLIILPLILIYARDYGARLALAITAIFYAAMVVAGLVVEALFAALGAVPAAPPAGMAEHALFAIDHTFWLNLGFGALGVALFAIARRSRGAPAAGCCHGDD